MNLARRGFTLVEMMVVISIISLLASLLFPVIARAKAAAKRSSCLANLSSNEKAIALYMNDYDDRFPLGKDAVDEFAPDPLPASRAHRITLLPRLNNLLAQYAGGTQTFRCPADVGIRIVESQFPRRVDLTPSVASVSGFSYEYHTDLGLAEIAGTALKEPSGVNLLNDLGGHWHGSAPAATAADSRDDFNSKTLEYRYNVLFADLRVKALTSDEKEASWRRG